MATDPQRRPSRDRLRRADSLPTLRRYDILEWPLTRRDCQNTTAAVDALGRRSSTRYDALGRPVEFRNPLLYVSRVEYNVDADATVSSDANGHATRVQSDRFGRPGVVTDPTGAAAAALYDRAGRVVTVTDPRGAVTRTDYDALGRPAAVTEAAGTPLARSTAYGYDGFGDLVAVTDPRGMVTELSREAGTGRVSSVTAGAGTPVALTTGYQFDLLDRVTGVTAPGGRATATAYDALGRVTGVTEAVGTPLERTTAFGYDGAGHRTTVTDALGQVTATAYDQLGRPVAVTDPNGHTVGVAYDQAGRVVSVTDPNQNVTAFGYDAAGRVATETDPLGQAIASAYDPAGRLVGVTERDGRRRGFGYDGAGRVTQEAWYAAAGPVAEVHDFGYDPAGNLTSASNPAGTYALTVDLLGQPTRVEGPSGVALDMTYDAGGNRLTVADNKGGVQASTYDALGRLSARELTAGGTTVRAAWGYDGAGDPVTLTRSEKVSGASAWTPAGVTATAYDGLGRVATIDTTSGAGATLSSYAYAYDAADRMTSETVDGDVRAYGYDAAGQLTSDDGTAYAYDPAGNRTGPGVVVGPGNRVLADGTWAYGYDAAGRQASKAKGGEAWAYGYDHAGRMTGATRSDGAGGPAGLTVGYEYDAFGNRVGRTEQTGSGPVSVERYAVDGWDTAKPGAVGTENFDTWADLDGAGDVTARRMSGPGFDEPLARLGGPTGDIGWYGADVRGSVRQVFDAAGVVAGARDYAAFGAITAEVGGGLDRYAYTGREWDGAVGLQYSRARMYDATRGAFTADDPLGFGAGDYNLGRYVGNQPTTRTDPSGLQPPQGKDVVDRWPGWPEIRAKIAEMNRLQGNERGLNPNDRRRLGDLKKWHSEHQGSLRANGVEPNYCGPTPGLDARTARELTEVQRNATVGLGARTDEDLGRAVAESVGVRFAGGVLSGTVNVIVGPALFVYNIDQLPATLEALTTDPEVRARVYAALVAKLSDDSAENVGELSVEIPLIVLGGAGVARAGANVTIKTLTLTREAAAAAVMRPENWARW